VGKNPPLIKARSGSGVGLGGDDNVDRGAGRPVWAGGVTITRVFFMPNRNGP